MGGTGRIVTAGLLLSIIRWLKKKDNEGNPEIDRVKNNFFSGV